MSTRSFVSAATEGRYDLYGPIHKGLRRAHGLMLTRLGAADFCDQRNAEALLADLRTHLMLAEVHLVDEERHMHAALDARAPGAPDRLEEQHAGHRASFMMLEEAIRAVESATGPAATVTAGRNLYLAFSRFVAEDLEHMAEEECETWPLLCSLFTDAELHGIEMAIVGSLDPAVNMAFLRHIVPAANHGERAGMLTGMKAAMPAAVYAGVVADAVIPDLDAGERGRLADLELLA